MTASSLVLLTPTAAIVAVAVVLPLVALVLAARRVHRTRTALRLPAPPPARTAPTVLAVVAVVALLAVAAAQPALRTRQTAAVRTDAQAMFVIDVSRSMLAAPSSTGRTRLRRAEQAAIALRAAVPQVPSGVATMTDRVLPDLLPNADLGVFDQTIAEAVGIDRPPPADQNVVATTLTSLAALGTQNFFPPAARHRLVVVLTDGESRPFDMQRISHALSTGPGVHLVLVHVWQPGETIYDSGRAETAYHADPASGDALETLAAATHGASFGEHALSAAMRAERAAVGSGPTIEEGTTERTRTLAPYAALLALVPLLLRLLLRRPRRRERATQPALQQTELVSP